MHCSGETTSWTTRGYENAIDLDVCDDVCYGILPLSGVARISVQDEVHPMQPYQTASPVCFRPNGSTGRWGTRRGRVRR